VLVVEDDDDSRESLVTVLEQYGVGLGDKLVERLPALARVLKPSLGVSRLIGGFRLAPTQFVVAEKQ